MTYFYAIFTLNVTLLDRSIFFYNMKSIYSVFLILVFRQINAQDTNEISKIDRLFYDRCYKYSPNAAVYDKFKENIKTFTSYAEYAGQLLPDRKEQFCETERPRLLGSVKEIVSSLYPCLPPEEKYLPQFLLTSFSKFMDFMCVKRGRNIDSFFSSQGQNCRTVLEQGDASAKIDQCFNKIFAPLRGFVKKDDLCEDMSIAKKCFTVILDTYCSDFVAYQNLNSEFFDSIRTPCSGCASIYGSAFLLAIATIYLLKLFS